MTAQQQQTEPRYVVYPCSESDDPKPYYRVWDTQHSQWLGWPVASQEKAQKGADEANKYDAGTKG